MTPKPPLVRDWSLVFAEKGESDSVCRNCRKAPPEVERLEWAHTIGREHDKENFILGLTDAGNPARLCLVVPNRVVRLCGPAVNTGTCHNKYDTSQLDIWDLMTDDEKDQAIHDAGSEGLAMRRCAPLVWKATYA